MNETALPFVIFVIPARNEESNIEAYITCKLICRLENNIRRVFKF